MQNEMITAFNNLVPTLDLSEGTPERDIFIEAPISGQLTNLWSQLDYNNRLISPISNYQSLTNTDIDTYCSNFGITRNPATKSTGSVVFYTYSTPSKDVVIQSGVLLATTSSTPYYFTVKTTTTIKLANIVSYYNTSNNRYEFTVGVESQEAGSSYRAGVGTITVIEKAISGIDGVTNISSISGGTDEEGNYSMMQRLISLFQSRGLYNTTGISNYVVNTAPTVLTVGAGDPLMKRDGGVGGCVDVYVKGTTVTSYTDSISITTTGLVNTTISGYTNRYIKLSKQPVVSIDQVLINGAAVASSYYILLSDTTSTVKKSTSANDKLYLTDLGLEKLGGFTSGMAIDIQYSYNSLLHTITSNLTSTQNKVEGRNYLVREFINVPISVAFYVIPSSGYAISDLTNTWNSILSNYFDSMSYGSTISASGFNSLLRGISTISGFDMTRIYFCKTSAGTPSAETTSDPLVVDKNCYPSLGSASFTLWSD